MNDNLFNRIEEKKPKVSKDTIISLARKLQDGDYIRMKNTLRDIIHELSFLLLVAK
ncbi:MAG: hypothetical protein L6V81_10905 [Clostridium sp.]|nr:MAG: hypothetical protein L6V81_10905 [Clostridium sp.]